MSIYPVVLQGQSACTCCSSAAAWATTRPGPTRAPLHDVAAAKQFDFFKLDEDGREPDGWLERILLEPREIHPELVKDARPKRGFYTYYPVERLKPDSAVVATFAGPKEASINGGKDEQPFIVSMRYRLRQNALPRLRRVLASAPV